MNNEVEIWKDIPGYEGLYQCSNFGRIKSLPRIVSNKVRSYLTKEKILKPYRQTSGYLKLDIRNNGITKTFMVHQLVVLTFSKKQPKGYKIVIDHIDNIKDNNKISNLQVITSRENVGKSSFSIYSKHLGVSYCKKNNKYISQIWINNKNINLGRYFSELEASKAYQKALAEIEQIKKAKNL